MTVHDLDIPRRRAWAAAHVAAAARRGPIPRYGTADWHHLALTDPRRWAAVIVAAEAWAAEDDPAVLRQRLEDDLTAARQVADADEAHSWARMIADYQRHITAPRRSELARRRGETPGEAS